MWSLMMAVFFTQYCSGDKIQKNEMGGTCNTYGEGRNLYGVLVGRPEGKTPLGRPRCRWEDNIKMDLQKVECGVWTGSSWLGIGIVGRHL
jgi:hypothetical protein